MEFKAIRLKVASPEEILKVSYGEIIRPETINYRTQRPEKDGLFSERIFGPTKDYECYCGKYKKIRYKGTICDKCGVEVTRSLVRRERTGHIKLATPIAHLWFLRSVPSRIGLILNIPLAKLERVVYYAAYVVVEVDENERERALKEIENEFKFRKKEEKDKEGELKEAAGTTKEILKDLRPGFVISETDFYSLSRKFSGAFKAMSGAEGIRYILERLDLNKEIKQIEKELQKSDELVKTQKLTRRLRFFRNMLKQNIRPEWMILTVLPVLPPELRPMVALDGGRYATSDLNDLYRRVINRNNRLKKLLELKAPEIIVINEKRMLQEAVDALIDNSTRGNKAQLSSRRRPLKSLADILKGKQGRFRQNLLGKRVDYSGRSVIVVGPQHDYDECGLPKKMALELFKPFVINKIFEKGLAYNIRNANRLIELAPPEVWEILEEVIGGKKVLLNRAPTLHRLGVQAFKPVLIEDLCIQIPPLVCRGFNADFDGDQMAVHLPLTEESQKESEELMLSSKNILKPSSGDPILGPWNDILLGAYYLTEIDPKGLGTGRVFSCDEEALMAYEIKEIGLQAFIKIGKNIETTCGRIIFNRALPIDFDFINETLIEKTFSKLIKKIINLYPLDKIKDIIKNIQDLGFEYATKSGISWGMSDLIVPKEKLEIVEKAKEKIVEIYKQREEGLLTTEETKIRAIAIWGQVKKDIEQIIKTILPYNNSVYKIVTSKARGNWEQINQMMGMRGLVKNPQGEIIDLPVISSYKEGFSSWEYFISVHGNRKGLVDTALKTAEAGYLTRRLVDAAQDLILVEKDCRVKEGIEVKREHGLEYGHKWSERIYSRVALEDIKIGHKVIVKEGEVIDLEKAQLIENSNLDLIKVRSPITCKSLYGVCSLCYGLDLGRNELVKEGEAVGVIAAQSIGEPGTQLTMRTTHVGGIAQVDITSGLPRVEEVFEARLPKGKALISEFDGIIEKIEDKEDTRNIFLRIKPKDYKIVDKKTKKNKIVEYQIPRAIILVVQLGQKIKKGDALTEGSLDLKEVLKLRGKEELCRYIISEIQRVYVSEGALINNKHIEIIIRQMFSRMKITFSGDSEFTVGEIIDKSVFLEANCILKNINKQLAQAEELFFGITKVVLSSDGFLSAVSFQEAARVLVSASTEGKVDKLRGLNENVIIGRLLPIGTNFRREFKTDEELEKNQDKE